MDILFSVIVGMEKISSLRECLRGNPRNLSSGVECECVTLLWITKRKQPTQLSLQGQSDLFGQRARMVTERGWATHPSGELRHLNILCVLELFFHFWKCILYKQLYKCCQRGEIILRHTGNSTRVIGAHFCQLNIYQQANNTNLWDASWKSNESESQRHI
jgi:hypothetical protein